MKPTLHGLHHVTAVTSDARANLAFYTSILGMRLVKKTVNQDDVSAYHLFYADELGSPGTELTFFEWKHVPQAHTGAGTVSETALRVRGRSALDTWMSRFDREGIHHGGIEPAWPNGPESLAFSDPEGQRLRLIVDRETASGHPWRDSPVPPEHAIIGLSAVTLSVPDLSRTAEFLTGVLGFRVEDNEAAVFATGEGGAGTRLRLVASREYGNPGAGGVHHVAWRVADKDEQRAWLARLSEFRVPSSGLVDRFYFQSLYFRIPGGILFEIATDGPGFTADGEDLEHLGEKLSLPPFLENRRAEIESGVEPLESVAGAPK